MTNTEKQIFKILLAGGHIVNNGPSGIRARDNKFNPIKKITARRFELIKDLMKKTKKGLWIISPAKVLKLRSNSWVKTEYKKLKKIAA